MIDYKIEIDTVHMMKQAYKQAVSKFKVCDIASTQVYYKMVGTMLYANTSTAEIEISLPDNYTVSTSE